MTGISVKVPDYLMELARELRELGYSINDAANGKVAVDDGARASLLLARMVTQLVARGVVWEKRIRDVSDDLAMLEYMKMLNSRILVELGFTDAELEMLGDSNADPLEVVIERIRDMKQSNNVTKH